MTDYECALEIRRGLLMIATAVYKRFGWGWLRIVLTGEDIKRCQNMDLAPFSAKNPENTPIVKK